MIQSSEKFLCTMGYFFLFHFLCSVSKTRINNVGSPRLIIWYSYLFCFCLFFFLLSYYFLTLSFNFSIRCFCYSFNFQEFFLIFSSLASSCFMCVCVCVCVHACAQSCPTLCGPLDCSTPGSSVHGIFQAKVLEWVVVSFSRGSSWPRDQTNPRLLRLLRWQVLCHLGSPLWIY